MYRNHKLQATNAVQYVKDQNVIPRQTQDRFNLN